MLHKCTCDSFHCNNPFRISDLEFSAYKKNRNPNIEIRNQSTVFLITIGGNPPTSRQELNMNSRNPYSPHKYSSGDPVAYFLTFRTYGTWLHGDLRGSTSRKKDQTGSKKVAPDPLLMQIEFSKLKQKPVTFTYIQRKLVDTTIRDVSDYNNWVLHALNVRTQHVHVVITAQKPPEQVENSLKSWCTRRMRENGLWDSEYSPWSRHGSSRYICDEAGLQRVCRYVTDGQSSVGYHKYHGPGHQGGRL